MPAIQFNEYPYPFIDGKTIAIEARKKCVRREQ